MRGKVAGWSRASRARMVRTLAEVDYSSLLRGGRVPVMVTLTLPGDWVTVAPTAAEFKRLVDKLRKRWGRRWGTPLVGVWKLEFQRRGAPHLHVLTAIPGENFRAWLSETWADVVAHPDPEQRARHLVAGTGVDMAEGMRARDPKRVAVYFSKHGISESGKDKSYQDVAPAEWAEAGTGRIWGVWGLDRVTAEVALTYQEAVEVQRLLRRWQRSQRVRVARWVTRRVRPEIIDMETGEVLQEAKYRRRRTHVRMGSGRAGGGEKWVLENQRGAGFQVVNDGPATAAMIRRLVESLRAAAAPPR